MTTFILGTLSTLMLYYGMIKYIGFCMKQGPQSSHGLHYSGCVDLEHAAVSTASLRYSDCTKMACNGNRRSSADEICINYIW